MLGLSLLSLAMTQTDKLILSKVLSLADFGIYTLASAVALSLQMLISPITKAWFPRLTQIQEIGDQEEFIRKFHQLAQLVTVLGGSAALVMIFQGKTFLFLWLQDPELATKASPLLSVLALGYLLNIFVWAPFETQLAHGSTSLPIRINLISVLIVVPAFIVITLTLEQSALPGFGYH